jgi:hypothetical protein
MITRSLRRVEAELWAAKSGKQRARTGFQPTQFSSDDDDEDEDEEDDAGGFGLSGGDGNPGAEVDFSGALAGTLS